MVKKIEEEKNQVTDKKEVQESNVRKIARKWEEIEKKGSEKDGVEVKKKVKQQLLNKLAAKPALENENCDENMSGKRSKLLENFIDTTPVGTFWSTFEGEKGTYLSTFEGKIGTVGLRKPVFQKADGGWSEKASLKKGQR